MPKYETNEKTKADLTNRFIHHAPKGDQAERYAQLRSECLVIAIGFCEACPPSRELSLALTHLEEAMMFANAAIARNE